MMHERVGDTLLRRVLGASGLIALMLVASATGVSSRAAAASAGRGVIAATTPLRPRSVRDSPGWYPAVDPESASVAIGRRTNAPLVQKPFEGGARSLDELGRRVCRFLHHEARDSMLALCVRPDEFRDIMWREFPESRPATGASWEYAWGMVDRRLRNGCSDAFNDHGGHNLEFIRFERADTTVRFKNFKIHRGLTLVARNDAGEIERFNWLRAVAERKGAYKIFSVRD